MAPPRYSDSDSHSDSDSDDAPEEVTLSSAKVATRAAEQKAQLVQRQVKEAQRKKNQEKDKRSKQQQAKKRQAQGQVEELQEEPDDEASTEEENEPIAPTASTSKHSYLDPTLFESAAELYKPAAQAAPGQGKRAAKKAAREEKRLARERKEERESMVGEGGSRQVGDVTIQHLASSAHTPSSLASTALPSHTSAAKFVTSRLYSKKRQVAVLDQAAPRPIPEDSRKRNKTGKKGMSQESKMLLGLGMDDGAKDGVDNPDELKRRRKRALLMQAQGQRKPATIARPLASARTKPAAVFAVAKRDR